MRKSHVLQTLGLSLVMAGCAAKQLKEIDSKLDELSDSRSPDARKGVLANELPPAARARLELLGRTSAPTRYSERSDANRLRVVAFDFGGAYLGQCADLAGNLYPTTCQATDGNIKEYWPTSNPPPAKTKTVNSDPADQTGAGAETRSANSKPAAPQIELRSGMFRQYSTQVGTTVDVDLGIGPVGSESKVYFSRNFLVLEWRRYTLQRMTPDVDSGQWFYEVAFDDGSLGRAHVSAIEVGIAVRVIFDVRLKTVDTKLSASFGIADLTTALARNEATVEVSYEVVGTSLDLLPEKAIIITSLNEYNNALNEFHGAVGEIARAWDKTRTVSPVDIEDRNNAKMTVRATDFGLGQLAYYVDGVGVGDTFEHLNQLSSCQDIDLLTTHYGERMEVARAKVDELTIAVASQQSRTQQKKALKKRLERLEKQHEQLDTSANQKRIKDIQKAVADAVKNKHKVETMLLEQQPIIETLEGEVRSLGRDVQHLQEQVKSPSTKPEELAKIQQELATKTAALAAKSKELDEARQKLVDSTLMHDQFAANIRRLEAERAELLGGNLRDQIEATERALAALTDEPLPSNKPTKKLQQELEDAENELDELEALAVALSTRAIGFGCPRVQHAENLRIVQVCAATCDNAAWIRLGCDEAISAAAAHGGSDPMRVDLLRRQIDESVRATQLKICSSQ